MTTVGSVVGLDIEVGEAMEAGPLRMFTLRSNGLAAPEYRCGPRGGQQGGLRVQERGVGPAVAELEVENTDALPVLLIGGDVLVGAKQNRTVNLSVLCPPGETVTVPVSCVERGRWDVPRASSLAARVAPADLRCLTARSMAKASRRTRSWHASQGPVWNLIDSYSRKRSVRSATMDLAEVQTRMAGETEAMIAGVRPVRDQQGVLVTAGNRVLCLDLFDKPATLATCWHALLTGYAFDAHGAAAPTVGRREAQAFVQATLSGRADRLPAIGLGEDLQVEDGNVAGTALLWDDAVVHLAAFPNQMPTAEGSQPLVASQL